MGATDFTTIMSGTDMAQAYREAVREATTEYGHDPYNGTISTTSGAQQVVFSPMTSRAASNYAHAHIDDAQKWEAALAVPIADDAQFTFTTAKFKLNLDPTNIQTEWQVRDAATEAAFNKYGSTLDRVEVTVKMTTKTVVENTPGRPVTRYQLTSGYYNNRTMYATRAEAVAAAKKLLTNDNNSSTEVGIRAVKVYESGTDAAVTVKKVTTKAVADVVVTLARPKKSLTTTGWLFFGLAAC